MALTPPAWHGPVLASQDRHYTVFSPGEIVVLALSSNPQHRMTKLDIGRWVLEHISYYQTLAADTFFSGAPPVIPALTVHALNRDINTHLDTYGTPIHQDVNGSRENVFWITTGAAYSALKLHIESVGFDHVAKPVTSTFPFMRLPTELRLRVYKMVLSAAGIRLKVENACFVGFDDKLPIWDASVRQPIPMPPPSNMLALLSVNKEIYREAMPEFYKQAHLHFDNMKLLGKFLTGIGPKRRKHLKNVTLSYTSLANAPAATSLLLESDMLQRLSLLIDIKVDSTTGHFSASPNKRKYKKLQNLPGLQNLQKIRGLKKLEFIPRLEHAVVKDFLSPFVFLPRGAEDPVTKTRTRAPAKRCRPVKNITAVDGEETEDEHPVPKKARRT